MGFAAVHTAVTILSQETEAQACDTLQMGRVRRYKKYKACDPASKSKNGSIDSTYDEPPDLFEERVRRNKKSRPNDWADEEQKELMMQREALRQLRNEASTISNREKQIEPKGADESIKDFKARLKQETRKTLAEELHKMTSTAKKRKMRLKEREQRKKSKKLHGANGSSKLEEIDFYSAENGNLRPSDLGQSNSEFATAEIIAFGERAERPPDLKPFTAKFNQIASKMVEVDDSSGDCTTKYRETNDDSQRDTLIEVDLMIDEAQSEEVLLSKNMKNKRRRAQQSILDRIDNVDNEDMRHLQKDNARNNKSATIKLVQSSGNSGSNLRGIEALRNRVKDAYKLIKERRLAVQQKKYPVH